MYALIQSNNIHRSPIRNYQPTCNGWICLKFLPQAADDDESCDSSNRDETEPHELFSEGPALLSNVTDAMKG